MQIDVEKLEVKYLGLHEELGTGNIEGESFTIIRQLNTGNIILDFGQGERYMVTLRKIVEGIYAFRSELNRVRRLAEAQVNP